MCHGFSRENSGIFLKMKYYSVQNLSVPIRLCVKLAPAPQLFCHKSHKQALNGMPVPVEPFYFLFGQIFGSGKFVRNAFLEMTLSGKIPSYFYKRLKKLSPVFFVKKPQSEHIPLDKRAPVAAAQLFGQRFKIFLAAAAL